MNKNILRMLALGLLALGIYSIAGGYFSGNSLRKHRKISTGIIKNIHRGGGGGQGNRIYIDYEYVIDNKTHTGSNAYPPEILTLENWHTFFDEKTIGVMYDSTHFFISKPITIPSDYKAYDLPVPDSLTFLEKYTNK